MNLQQMLEARAYYTDSRNCQRAQPPVLYLADGTEKALPVKWVVCPVCDGEGEHINPAIDCGGLTAEDFAEDPDFAEGYVRGDYKQPCNRCGGRTTVPEVDLDRLSAEDGALFERQQREAAEYDAIERAERMRGA